jgi:hypothetical protein
MRYATRLCGVAFVGAALSLSAGRSSNAQPADILPPDTLHSFRFLAGRSTLNVQGGFAGIDLTYNLFGRFDLARSYELSPLAIYPPIIVGSAEFENVRAIALLNHPAADARPVPLSHFVDLETLHGHFFPREPGEIFFRGFDNQEMPFTLKASQRGRLLHLTGQNDPSCCDFFHYKLDAWAHLAPLADFNLDRVVDRLDLERFRSNYGLQAGATFEQGDADADGDVDGRDFAIWQSDVGLSFGDDELLEFAAAQNAVPEPATGAILLLAASAFCRSLRRRHSASR